MAKSNKPFHPLDAENNRRYKVTPGQSPQLPWAYSDDLTVHDWEGYIRVEETGNHTIKMTVDDNGYIEIDGKKVVEVTGSNASTSREATIELKKGFHYAKFHHENMEVPEDIKPYPNAAQFEAFIDGQAIALKDIDAPKNIWKAENAQKLLGCYNVVDYKTKSTNEVWAFIGGWLNDQHLSGDGNYYNSCALRLSIGFSRYGTSLSGVKDANGKPAATNITLTNPAGNLSALNPDMSDPSSLRKHVVISAAAMNSYLISIFGNPDYTDDSEKGYCSPQDDDILIFGDGGHVGMCPGSDMEIGAYDGRPIWLLHRSTLDD